MSNRIRDKKRRARLSLQNRDLASNQLNLFLQNMGLKQEEPEVTEEEDYLKIFSQQQRKKEKEEEAKKYLHPIAEEDDPLKFFDQKVNEEKEQDPLKFLKNEEKGDDGSKILENLSKYDEKKLAEAIKNNDIPEEINVQKKKNERSSSEDKEKKMAKKLRTALRLSQKVNLVRRINEKLLNRVKNSNKNVANVEEAIKKATDSTKDGNTLLAEDEQIDPTKNGQPIRQTKEVDLKSFMKKNSKKDDAPK